MNFCKMCGTSLRNLRKCPQCGGQTPANFAFCQNCGNKLAGEAGGGIIAETLSADRPAAGGLVLIQRDGREGERFRLDLVTDMGRAEGEVLFADDRLLAPRHARVERRGPGVLLVPLDRVNGIYVRLRRGEKWRLVDGDRLLVGKEVFRFEAVPADERAVMQHGVRLFGSPLRQAWGRLVQVVVSGIDRDVYHLSQAEIVIGRDGGDIRYPDDEFLSRLHARLAPLDGGAELTDLDSSNGTFIRLRAERSLEAGDCFRIGDQLIRYDAT